MGENPNDKKEDRIKKFQIVAFLLLVVLPLVIVAFFIGLLIALKINLLSPIDSSTINGLLTAIAIVFGFASYEAREIKESRIKYLLIGALVIVLMVTTESYFLSEMISGQTIKAVLFIAMCNLIFNIYCSLLR